MVHSLLSRQTIFTNPTANQKNLASRLLKAIQLADYSDIQCLWKPRPELMFVEVLNDDGELTTPLKQALFLLDKWTWQPFYEWLQNNRQDLVPEFLQQHAEQTKHIDDTRLQAYFDAMQAMHDSITLWYKNKMTDAELLKQWKQLGIIQDQTLPVHMIKEMCRGNLGFPDRNWYPNSKFDAVTPPSFDVRRSNIGCGISQNTLVRGKENRAIAASAPGSWALHALPKRLKYDADCMRQLIQVRSEELKQIPVPGVSFSLSDVAR